MLIGAPLQRESARSWVPPSSRGRTHTVDGPDSTPHLLSVGAFRPLYTVRVLLHATLCMEKERR